MVFYGISLGVTDLAGDPYLNMVISGGAECVGLVLTVIMLNKVGRRWPMCVFMVFGGLSCLAVNFLPPGESTNPGESLPPDESLSLCESLSSG
jgi:OCT family organic cation transporter-like MFS transporter 4/5